MPFLGQIAQLDFTVFCREFYCRWGYAFFVLIFFGKKRARANFYTFCMSATDLRVFGANFVGPKSVHVQIFTLFACLPYTTKYIYIDYWYPNA